MNKDIVESLREAAHKAVTDHDFYMLNVAANEIEELRINRNKWQKIADDLYLLAIRAYGDDVMHKSIEIYEKHMFDSDTI